jgi:hypothetical protein
MEHDYGWEDLHTEVTIHVSTDLLLPGLHLNKAHVDLNEMSLILEICIVWGGHIWC